MSVTMYVTQFADAPVLTGLTVALCAALGFAGCLRAAITFGGMFVTLVICVVAAKGMVAEWPGLAAATDLRSPSGHVAGTVVLIGGATMCARRGSWLLMTALGAGLIAYTRVRLGFHTLPDVVAGGVIGVVLLGLAVMLGVTRNLTAVPSQVGAPLLGVLIAAAIFLNGWHPGVGQAASRAASDFPSWTDRLPVGETP